MKNKKGIVYTITNKETKETYVGITTYSLRRRRLDHLKKCKKENKSKFIEALATFGEEAFEFEEIDSTYSINELAEKERMYIKKYKEQGISLNSSNGGEVKKIIYLYNLNGKLIAKFDSLEVAAKTVNASKQQISGACLSINKLFKGYYWSYIYKEPYAPGEDKRRKKVFQYSMEGSFITEFISVSKASQSTGVNKTSIAKVTRGERKTAGGFIWRYGV